MAERDETLDLEELSTGDRPLALPDELPILPLRDTVLFPNSFMPLAVARESSVRLIDEAISGGKLIGCSRSATPRSRSRSRPTCTPSAPPVTSTRCSSCPTAACG